MTAERPKCVMKKPKRFAEEFSRSMTVTKTEARKGAKRLFDVEVTELDKVNKRVKIHFVDYSTQFDKWRFYGGYESPFKFHFPNRIFHQCRQITYQIKGISRSFQFWRCIYKKELENGQARFCPRSSVKSFDES